MKIDKIKIDWAERYANRPRFKIYTNACMPDLSEFRFDSRTYLDVKNCLYFAERDGWVRFFSYSGPGDGYGGTSFDITMYNGLKKTLIGPGSSRAGVMNDAGFIPCIDVVLNDSIATAITLQCLLEAIVNDRGDLEGKFEEGSRMTVIVVKEYSTDIRYEPCIVLPDDTYYIKPGLHEPYAYEVKE